MVVNNHHSKTGLTHLKPISKKLFWTGMSKYMQLLIQDDRQSAVTVIYDGSCYIKRTFKKAITDRYRALLRLQVPPQGHHHPHSHRRDQIEGPHFPQLQEQYSEYE